MLIDYRKIADSIDFFEKLGYQRVEAPWWVPPQIIEITRPEGYTEANDYYLAKNSKCLVASAEQSFLYMANQGLLPKGKYQATTPCFREEVQGPLKRKYFIKNELIITDTVNKNALSTIVEQAVAFFKTQVPDISKLSIVAINDTFDVEYAGVELGSYGIRSTPYLDWIYATGCAEPRLTRAIQNGNYQGK